MFEINVKRLINIVRLNLIKEKCTNRFPQLINWIDSESAKFNANKSKFH